MTRRIILERTTGEHLRQELTATDYLLSLPIVYRLLYDLYGLVAIRTMTRLLACGAVASNHSSPDRG